MKAVETGQQKTRPCKICVPKRPCRSDFQLHFFRFSIRFWQIIPDLSILLPNIAKKTRNPGGKKEEKKHLVLCTLTYTPDEKTMRDEMTKWTMACLNPKLWILQNRSLEMLGFCLNKPEYAGFRPLQLGQHPKSKKTSPQTVNAWIFAGNYAPEVRHGTWKCGKGDSFSKPSFSDSIWNFGGNQLIGSLILLGTVLYPIPALLSRWFCCNPGVPGGI